MPSEAERLSWSPQAERDVREIWAYYAVRASAEAASKVLRTIEAAVGRVANLPMAGRPRDDLRPSLRSVLAHPYLIFYRLKDGGVEIVRVLHERRDLPKALAKPGEK
jgi:toxin ParE1/3/4